MHKVRVSLVLLIFATIGWADWDDPFNTFADYTRGEVPVQIPMDSMTSKISKDIFGTPPGKLKQISFESSVTINSPLNDSGGISVVPNFNVSYEIPSNMTFLLGANLSGNRLEAVNAILDGKWKSFFGLKAIQPTLRLEYNYEIITSTNGIPSFALTPGLISTLPYNNSPFSLGLTCAPTICWNAEGTEASINLSLKPRIEIGSILAFHFLTRSKWNLTGDSLDLFVGFLPTIELGNENASNLSFNFGIDYYRSSITFSPGIKGSLGNIPIQPVLKVSCDVPQPFNYLTPKVILQFKL